MRITSTLTRVKTTPTYSKIKSQAQHARTTATSQVQHNVEANLIGKGKTARVHTTHTFKRNTRTLTGTYGAGRGNINLQYNHHVNRRLVTRGTYNVNVRHAAVGGVAAYGGYKAYQHRSEIKQKAATLHSGVHNAFHSTRSTLSG